MNSPAPRYSITVSVTLTTQDTEGGLSGFTRNISQSGMLITSTATRPSGALVHFESPPFSGEAEVIWTGENEGELLLGLKFVSLSELDRESLEAFLEFAG